HRGSRHHLPVGPALYAGVRGGRPPVSARSRDRWIVDETYLEIVGRWSYLYRAVDQHGQVIDYCCPRGATWQLPGASSPGRCGPARSRSKSRWTAHPSTRGSSTSWSPRHCTPLSSTRITRSRQTTDG